MIEAGISSSAHIAEFFGLTDTLRRTRAETTELPRRATLFGALREATRPHRIRAVRAWRDVSGTSKEAGPDWVDSSHDQPAEQCLLRASLQASDRHFAEASDLTREGGNRGRLVES